MHQQGIGSVSVDSAHVPVRLREAVSSEQCGKGVDMRSHRNGVATMRARVLAVIACVTVSSCATTVQRASMYKTHDQRSMVLYERQLAEMAPEAIKAEAEALRRDMIVNDQDVQDAQLALVAAMEVQRRAAPDTAVERGAQYIEAQQRHKRAVHRGARMRQVAGIIKEQYASKFE
jgi:hypothetical protein